MALESATYPNQLVATNPTGADPKGAGDDHIRMLKRVLQATFPNITGAVTMTQAQLNVLGTPNLFVQPGMIVMWSGPLNALPAGWLLCNGVGTITGGLSVPDLRDRFILGAGASAAVRAVGGTSTHTHALSVSITPTALDISQIPSHNHSIVNRCTTFDGGSSGHSAVVPNYSEGARPTEVKATDSVGSGAAHTHGVSSSLGAAVNHIPPFMALGFIIKE